MPRKRCFDQLLLVTALIMMGIGVIMVYNASAIIAVTKYGQSPFHFLRIHLCHLFVALCFLIGAMKSPYTVWKRWAPVFLIASFVMLLLVFAPHIGLKWGGARRWIKITSFLSFQPSELAKMAIIFFMASFIAKKKNKPEELESISSPLFLMLGAFFALIVAQPDLGTAALLVIVGLTMLYVAGFRLRYLILPLLVFICCTGILIWITPYRVTRVLSHLNPWEDPTGSGYQLIQSIVAIGSGGKMGTGLGNAVQSGITIPEPFTDFIFAIIGKEVGLVGTCLIVCLFFLIAWRGLRIALNCRDSFGVNLAVGITCLIVYQGLINMGVVTGLLPTKGITLPFISYGGTSLVFNALGVGILLNVSQYT
ncbi:MAG: putative lipid II flippase FtsW [bacterium]